MARRAKKLTATGFLVALGLFGGVEIAAACTAECVLVSPPYCRRCQDTGMYTGLTCTNFGACGCIVSSKECGPFAAAPAEETAALPAPVCTEAAPAAAPTPTPS